MQGLAQKGERRKTSPDPLKRPHRAQQASNTQRSNNDHIRQVLTAIGDVESSARHRVIGLKLQLQDVAVGCEVRGNLGAGETAHQRAARLVPVFDGEEVVGRLQVKVIERQVNPGAGLGDDQPNTVEVVAVALWVVWRQHGPHRRREVGEAGDCGMKKKKKRDIYQKAVTAGEFVRSYTATDHVTVRCGVLP